MGDGEDCEMRGVGMHGSATGTAEPEKPGGAAQAVGGMRERGAVREARDARDARDAREVPLEAQVEECPATDELRASFRSAINRILLQSHGIYNVALRSSPSQSHAESQRGEEMGALLHQVRAPWGERGGGGEGEKGGKRGRGRRGEGGKGRGGKREGEGGGIEREKGNSWYCSHLLTIAVPPPYFTSCVRSSLPLPLLFRLSYFSPLATCTWKLTSRPLKSHASPEPAIPSPLSMSPSHPPSPLPHSPAPTSLLPCQSRRPCRGAAGVPGGGGTAREVAAVRVESSRQQVQALKQAIHLVSARSHLS
ncbi:unnamed protein product [Closterium sp. NIES-65]|nr:unnamed protein product [Closterium sp. NIES-65]